MFLKALQTKNPNFIQAIFRLHQNGDILPDSTVIDFEAVRHNGKILVEQAHRYRLSPFFTTKQFGFNPMLAKMLIDMGFTGVSCVDYREAQMCLRHQLPIAHIGQIVQIPERLIETFIHYGVEFCTIYSSMKAKQINVIAKKMGKTQKIMLKINDPSVLHHQGQAGGFSLEDLPEIVAELKKLKNLEISGLTAFPCWLFSYDDQAISPTPNIALLQKAKNILNELGVKITHINMPSSNAHILVPDIAASGGTQIEAGHSLTGTTPCHAYDSKLLEIPAMAYVSEISHHYQNKSYFYGGGLYRRYPPMHALVGTSNENWRYSPIDAVDNESIDYYFCLSRLFRIGLTVIAGFRTQVFATRSEVVIVDKLQSDPDNIEVIGCFSPLGDLRS